MSENGWRVTKSGTASDNEWQRVTKNDNEWQWMTASDKIRTRMRVSKTECFYVSTEAKDQSGYSIILCNFLWNIQLPSEAAVRWCFSK